MCIDNYQLYHTSCMFQFRLHKTAKAEQTTLFFNEWEKYLDHIVRTGREKQSIDVGLVDQPHNGSSNSNNNPMVHKHKSERTITFGKDVPKDIELTEEQKSQLEALKQEAAKAAGGNNGNGKIQIPATNHDYVPHI